MRKLQKKGKFMLGGILEISWGNRGQRQKATCLRPYSESETAGANPKSPADPGVGLAHPAHDPRGPGAEQQQQLTIVKVSLCQAVMCLTFSLLTTTL